MLPVHGWVTPRFEGVRKAFAHNLAHYTDVGAACCVIHRGTVVADLWAGFADLAGGRIWEEDTPQLVFSATKGVTATCVHLLVERGQLDVDVPIAVYWPEFAANGKADIPLRWALCHKAGLAAVDGELTLAQVFAWAPVVDAIARQAPNWEPGTAHGYHARTFGWILGEVVRRVTGRSLGRFFADEIADPFGIDFWVGVPESVLPRVARIIPPESLPSIADLLGATALTTRVMNGPSGLFAYDDMWNRADLLRAEMPSSNGVGTARGLAKMYAALVSDIDGKRLLRPETVAAASVVQANGPDRVILFPSCYGLGYTLQPMLAPGAGPRAVGHPGAGGSLAFADPEHELAFAYVTTRMLFDPTGDVRSKDLVGATYGALA